MEHAVSGVDVLGGDEVVLIVGDDLAVRCGIARAEDRDALVVAVIPESGTVDVQTLVDAGADDFVVWPRDQEHLAVRLTTLRQRVGRRTSADELELRALASLPDPMFVTDEGGRWVYVNDAFCALVGHSREALIGKTESGILLWETERATFTSAGATESEASFTDMNGQRHIVSTRRATFDAAPGVVRTVSVVRDLTQNKERQAEHLLHDRLTTVGTLAAGVSHEINNPLAYILANLDFIAEAFPRLRAAEDSDVDMVDVGQALSDAQDGASRVRDIVRDLRTFASSDEPTMTDVDVRRAVEMAVRMASGEIRRRARLFVDLGELPRVHGNESRLAQVFVNLLINAVQAIPQRPAREPEIRVQSRIEHGWAVVEVSDTGGGISADVARRIFDPFFTTHDVGAGTGLGLFVCHNIVTSLGGTIEFDSRPGEGTTFRVLLPASGASPDARPTLRARRSMNATVLVVDDEARMGAAVVRMLSPEHHVVPVASGAEALELLTAGLRFDLVVCDLLMPGMSGIELYAELATVAPEVLPKIVFATGGAFTADAAEFLRTSGARAIEKPFDRELLLSIIEKLHG